MKLDLHVHSKNSIDALSLEKTIVETAKKQQLGFALTDHDCIDGWQPANVYSKKFNVPFIQGEEILVFHGKKIAGEIIGLFMNKYVEHGQVFEVIDELKKQNALITVPHSFDKLRKGLFCNLKKSEIESVARKVDAIEVFNGRVHLNQFNKKAEVFALEKNLGKTAGSDAHTPEEIGNAFIECEATSLEEARKLIKKGKVSFNGRLANLKDHLMTQLAKRELIKDK